MDKIRTGLTSTEGLKQLSFDDSTIWRLNMVRHSVIRKHQQDYMAIAIPLVKKNGQCWGVQRSNVLYGLDRRSADGHLSRTHERWTKWVKATEVLLDRSRLSLVSQRRQSCRAPCLWDYGGDQTLCSMVPLGQPLSLWNKLVSHIESNWTARGGMYGVTASTKQMWYTDRNDVNWVRVSGDATSMMGRLYVKWNKKKVECATENIKGRRRN
jgi:hypothetical protein